jgi:sulfite reductase alpha subunit-like flavoprotein
LTENAIDGLLERSQDQPKKLYVTHRLKERGAAVWAMLERGGYVYVSGAAGKMPRDVLAALEEVVATHGSMTPADAKQWVRQAETARRIQVETWA